MAGIILDGKWFSRLALPLLLLTASAWAVGAEEEKASPGESKYPGEKWKLVNVVNISGDALKFAIGKGAEGDLPGGKIIIHEYSREEQTAEPEQIIKFYRSRLKDPDAKPLIQVSSPEQCEAMEVYVTHLNGDDTSQFCLVSVDSGTVTVIEIVSDMVDDVLRSLGGSMESISDSIRKEMDAHRIEMKDMQKDLLKEKHIIIQRKGELSEDQDELKKEAEELRKKNEELRNELEKLRKERERP